jgi:thioredoxin-like negative regulator of GroEL
MMRHFSDFNFLTETDFSKFINGKDQIQMVICTAEWSAMSHLIQSTLDEVSKVFKKELAIDFIDMDRNQSISSAYGIHAIPTILIFKRGKLVEKIEKLITAKDLISRIEVHS